MSRTILVVTLTIAVLMFGIVGCKKAADEQPADVKTAEEYKQDAEKEITEENMDAELENIEKQLNTEAAEEQ